MELNQFSRIFTKIINPFDPVRIGLFDIWVENTDRKPTNPNIILSVSGNHITIMAIDHAFTFDSVSYSDLNASYINNTYNENIIGTRMVQDILALKKKDFSFLLLTSSFFILI